MSGWREMKRKALADIHRQFEIPAVYLTHADGQPVAVNVRLHLKQIFSEQLVADWASAGKTLDLNNRIIFRAAEVQHPLQRAYVVFSPTEAYIIGPSKPERETYIWCDVTPCPTNELRKLLNGINRSDETWGTILTGFVPDPPPPVEPEEP